MRKNEIKLIAVFMISLIVFWPIVSSENVFGDEPAPIVAGVIPTPACSATKGDFNGDSVVDSQDLALLASVVDDVNNNSYDASGNNVTWTEEFSVTKGETKSLSTPIRFDADWVIEMQGNFDFSEELRGADAELLKALFRDSTYNCKGCERLSLGVYTQGQLPGQTLEVTPSLNFIFSSDESSPDIRVKTAYKGGTWNGNGLASTVKTESTGNNILRLVYLFDEKRFRMYWDNQLVGSFEITDQASLGAKAKGNGYGFAVDSISFEMSSGDFKYYVGDLKQFSTKYGELQCADFNEDGVISYEDVICMNHYITDPSGYKDNWSCYSCAQKGVEEGWYYTFEVCDDDVDNDCDTVVDFARAGNRVDLNFCGCSGIGGTWCWDYPFYDLDTTPGIDDNNYAVCMSHSWESTDVYGNKFGPMEKHLENINSGTLEPACTPEYSCQINFCFDNFRICNQGEWRQFGGGSTEFRVEDLEELGASEDAISKFTASRGEFRERAKNYIPGKAGTTYSSGVQSKYDMGYGITGGSECIAGAPSSTAEELFGSGSETSTAIDAVAPSEACMPAGSNAAGVDENGETTGPWLSMDGQHYIGAECGEGSNSYYGPWGSFMPCEGPNTLAGDGWDNNCLGGDGGTCGGSGVGNAAEEALEDESVFGLMDANDFLDFMDSSIIKTLTKITNILYAITTVIKTLKTIISALAIFPGNKQTCPISPYGYPICVAVDIAYQIIGKIDTVWAPVATVVMCESKNAGWPLHSWCSSKGFLNLGGTNRYHLDPYENIYTAVACLCPTAILFNLRKLEVIYKTFKCCMESSCQGTGYTEGCYEYLDKATCMYWEGSLMDMLWDLIVSLIAYFLGQLIIKYLLIEVLRLSTTTAQAIVDIIEAGFAIAGLGKALKWLEKQFHDPNCADMMKDIGMNYETSSIKTQRDLQMNSDGVYTGAS